MENNDRVIKEFYNKFTYKAGDGIRFLGNPKTVTDVLNWVYSQLSKKQMEIDDLKSVLEDLKKDNDMLLGRSKTAYKKLYDLKNKYEKDVVANTRSEGFKTVKE